MSNGTFYLPDRELKKKAVSFAEEQLQLTYEDAYYVYYSANDVLNEEIRFIFVQEDHNTFVLTYYWNGVIRNLYKSKFSTYQEKYEEIKNTMEMVENYNNQREQTEIHLFFEKIENME